jgi:hypothetical protein
MPSCSFDPEYVLVLYTTANEASSDDTTIVVLRRSTERFG